MTTFNSSLPRTKTSRAPKRALSSSYKPSKARRDALQELLARFPGGVPRAEYPRPRLVRGDDQSWRSLNGAWEFTFDTLDVEGFSPGALDRWQDKSHPDFCVVPFAPQWPLSGKNEKKVYEVAWYARDFEVPSAWIGEGSRVDPDRDVLLHFGACDYKTTVWVNGREVGHNQGGHVPFSFDITALLQPGQNRLALRVEDRQDGRQPRGKQAVDAQSSGCDYWCTTGLWQSVWLESAPGLRVQDVVLVPRAGSDSQKDALEVVAYLHAPALGWRVEVEVFGSIEDAPNGGWELGATPLCRVEEAATGAVARLVIPLPDAPRWSVDEPNLLGVRVRLLDGSGAVQDEVRTYAGLRSVALQGGKFHLNGQPLYLQMVLDQGYWPDGGLTAPTDDDLKRDIEWIKAFGFNTARKHQKVEDPRWLYFCDRLGLLVWGEMANARVWSPTAEEWFLAEWERVVRRDASHPCVVAWVPHNESWGMPGLESDHPGQHAFVERVVALTRRLDPTRPVVSNDGWEHADVTDIVAIHDYRVGAKLKKHWAKTVETGVLPERTWAKTKRVFVEGARHRGQPVMLTEIGGFLNVPDLPREKWDSLYNFYNMARTDDELLQKYRELMEIMASFHFASGWCYTQLTDVEQEVNGLLTYDRKPKIAPERIKAIHQELFGSPEEPSSRD